MVSRASAARKPFVVALHLLGDSPADLAAATNSLSSRNNRTSFGDLPLSTTREVLASCRRVFTIGGRASTNSFLKIEFLCGESINYSAVLVKDYVRYTLVCRQGAVDPIYQKQRSANF